MGIFIPSADPNDADFKKKLQDMSQVMRDFQAGNAAPREEMGFVERLRTSGLLDPGGPVRGLGSVAARTLGGPIAPLAASTTALTDLADFQGRVADNRRAVAERSDFRAQRAADLFTPDLENDSPIVAMTKMILGGPLAKGHPIAQLGEFTPEESQADAEQRLQEAHVDKKALEETQELRKAVGEIVDEQQPGGMHAALMGEEGVSTPAEAAQASESAARTAAAKETQEAAEAVTDPAKQRTQAAWLNAGRTAVAGAGHLINRLPLGIGQMWDMATTGGAMQSAPTEWAMGFDKMIDGILPTDDARDKELLTKVAGATGSLLGYMVLVLGAGAMAPAAGFTPTGAQLVMSGIVGGSEGYSEAEAVNAGSVSKLMSFVVHAGLGLTELIPVMAMLGRAEGYTGGAVSRFIARTTTSSLEEVIQEVSTTIASDVWAEWWHQVNRDMSLQKYAETALISGIAGAIGGATGNAVVDESEAARNRPQLSPEQEQAMSNLSRLVEQRDAAAAAEQPQVPGAEPAAMREARDAIVEGLQDQFDSIGGMDMTDAEIAAGEAMSDILAEEGEAVTTAPPGRALKQTPGGLIPMDPDGKLRITHDSQRLLDEIDPFMRGTGSYKGAERARLGTPPSQPTALEQRRLDVLAAMEKRADKMEDLAPQKGASLKSAIQVEGVVYTAEGSHLDVLATMPPNVRRKAERDADNRGFVNARGKFLDRVAAQEYALDNGLIKDTAPRWAFTSPELIAENLKVAPDRRAAYVAGAEAAARGQTPTPEEFGDASSAYEKGVSDTLDAMQRRKPPAIPGVEERDPNVVDRSYFGITEEGFTPPPGETFKNTDPYHGEEAGNIRHTVAVDPDTLYNWREDPLDLRSQLTAVTQAERQTEMERLVRDAGFKGIYFPDSEVGQTVMMFEKTTPEKVVDKYYGLPPQEIAKPADFKAPTAQTFAEKGGWAVITATRESIEGGHLAPENIEANARLRNTLRRRGIKFQEVGGVYQGVDQGKSLLIFAPEGVARELGEEFGQESVLTRAGLEYTDGSGRLVPAVHEETVIGDAAKQNDFYSVLPDGTAFSLGLDFGGTVDAEADIDFVEALGEPVEFENDDDIFGMRALPAGVKLVVNKNSGNREIRALGPNGNEIGYLTMERYGDAAEKNEVFNMAVRPAWQRKGLMTALHEKAEAEFGTITPSRTLSDEGFAFWKGFRPEAIKERLRFYADELIGQRVDTKSGPATVTSVGDRTLIATLDGQNATVVVPQAEVDRLRANLGNDIFGMRAKPKPEPTQKLVDQVPGLKGVLKGLTPEEQADLTKAGAKAIVDTFTKLPDPKEMAAVAFSGRAKRGWYRRSARALLDIFGMQDAPRYAALLAALSPQVSVESNAVNALNVWTAWIKEGRPTDISTIKRIMGENVQGDKGEKSILDSWINNSVEALTRDDPQLIDLSGPKVTSFMQNLRDVVNEVTNDAWMANYADVEQKLFASAYRKAPPGSTQARMAELEPEIDPKTGKPKPAKIGRKSAGYLAMSAAVRRAAQIATELTGETWTPSEIQETVWSWAKTLYEKADAAVGAEQLLKLGKLTAQEIGATPDFATLFTSGVYRTILEAGGYDVEQIAASSQQPDAGDAGGGDPLSAEGSGLDQRAFDQNLRRAARRLDAVRQRRAEEKAAKERDKAVSKGRRVKDETRPEDNILDTFFPDADIPRRPAPTESLMDADDMFAARGRTMLKGEQQRPAGGVPGQTTEADVDLSSVKLGRNLKKLMALTARQGRLTLKGADVLGQYTRSTGVIRLRSVGDFPSLVHEAGHALHMASALPLKTFEKTHERALMDVATDLYGGDVNTLSKSNHIAEGFAEMFRTYVTNRAYLDNKWPQLATDLDALLKKEDPGMFQGLQLLQLQYDRMKQQIPSTQTVRNLVVPGVEEKGVRAVITELKEKGVATWWQEKASRWLEVGVNRWVPLNSVVTDLLNLAERNKGAPLDLKVSEDPRKMMVLAANSASLAMVEAREGINPRGSNKSATRSIRDMEAISQGYDPKVSNFETDPQVAADFDAYLIALRAIDEYRRLDEGKINREPINPQDVSRDDLVQAVKDYEAQYPQFVEAGEIAHEINTAMWHKAYDAGLIDKETYDDGLDRRFYVPLLRDMSDKRNEIGASALSSGQKLVHRFGGSDRLIVSPTAMMMQKLFALEHAIARNDVKLLLAQLADRAGQGSGAIVERVPATTLIGQQLSVKEAARALTKDAQLSAADAQDLMTMLDASMKDGDIIKFFKAQQISTSGENIVFFWEKGKIKAMQLVDGEVGQSVAELLDGIGHENMPFATSLIAGASQLMRFGIIHWPDYIVMNFARDQFQTWILSDVGFTPFASGLRGAYDELTQSDLAKQYNASMAMMGGAQVAALHEARVDHDIKVLNAKGYRAQVFSEGMLKGLARATEFTETGTRMGLWRNAYLRAKADGLSDYDAGLEAAYIATDIMNFGMNGSRTAFQRRTIPFLNSQIIGLYKLLRTLGGDEVRQRKGLRFALSAYFKNVNNLPLSRTEKAAVRTGRKAWVKMSALALLSAAVHFAFEDDEDYQETSEYLRATGWVIPMGDGRIFYFPKPFEMALLANFVERALEQGKGDKEAKNRFLRGLGLTLIPPMSPPGITLLYELQANRDLFTGREITNKDMQGLSPHLRYNHYTSTLAKEIGKLGIPGLSPVVTDHILQSLGASMYRDIATVVNTLDPNRPPMDATDAPIVRRVVRDVRRGSASSKDFWNRASAVNGSFTQAANSYKMLIDDGLEEMAESELMKMDDDRRAYALLIAHFKPEAERLHPFYRVRDLNSVVNSLQREMVSELPVADTSVKDFPGEIVLNASTKGELDEALSELSRREIRNALVTLKVPGWSGKKMMDTEYTKEIIRDISPEIADELDRRLVKKKVYPAEVVQEYWPEVKDRLLTDGQDAYLDDLSSLAKTLAQ